MSKYRPITKPSRNFITPITTVICTLPISKQYEPLRRECQHFLDCIKTGETPESSGIEALKVVNVLEAASKSLKDGGCKIALETCYPSKGIL